jgi:hypothetical protein
MCHSVYLCVSASLSMHFVAVICEELLGDGDTNAPRKKVNNWTAIRAHTK